MLVLLPGLPELREFAVQHVCGRGNGRNGWFGEQRGQRRSVFLLSREEESLSKGKRLPWNNIYQDWVASLGKPVPALLVTISLAHTKGKEQYLCIVQATSLSEDF